MRKFTKYVILGLLPILFVLLITLFINIFVTDWRYAHKSHMVFQEPFNWALYRSELFIHKFIRSLANNTKKGLPTVRLYISEQSQRSLLKNTPVSTKKWVRGYFLLDNGTLKKIKVRHRGDNPQNWLFEKKNWRIKTAKSEIFDRKRYVEYWPFNLAQYVSGSVANRMKILSPKFRLVELFINDESSGIFIETEKLNESFLRRNKLMPVNLYKGEQILTESVIATEFDLFNNPNVWRKLAYFNQTDERDKSDLIKFLSLLRGAESEKISFDELLQMADLDVWSNLAAYQILTQNFHNDHTHNMRLVFDPWSGIIYPIVNDPIIGNGIYENYVLPLETSSHSLFLLLNRSSIFIDAKYTKILDYIKKFEILTNQAISLRKMESAIYNSEKRDITFSRTLYRSINWSESFKKQKIITQKGKPERENIAQYLERHQTNILDQLYLEPNFSWFENINGFSLFINGEIPVSDLIISYKLNIPKWIAIDVNSNGIVDVDEEKFMSNQNGNIVLPIRLYSNRIILSEATYDMYTTSNVKSVNTKFNVISENSSKPYSISGTNPFSGKRFIFQPLYSEAVLPSKYNVPIYNTESHKINDNIKEFSGTINVKGNIIVNKKTKIYPGTNFKLDKGASIIFKNQVIAQGTSDQPIIFEKKDPNSKPWGTIALQGNKSSGSIFNNIIMNGGSGNEINQIRYTSMFSLHNTNDVEIKNLRMKNNSTYDDMLHIVYCNNITINDAILENANSDAIDVDMSKKIIIKKAVILNPVNDSIDLMETEALIDSSYMSGSGDKAVSVGENSNVIIYNSFFHKNNIGLASKDKSKTYVLYSDLESNKIHLSVYAKNWQYGSGGTTNVYKSYFAGTINEFNSTKKSSITIEDSSVVGKVNKKGENLLFQDDIDYFDSRKTSDENDILITHPLFSYISPVENKYKRGSDILINKIQN